MVIIGLNSLFNTCLWINKAYKKHQQSNKIAKIFRISYNEHKNVNGSQLTLDRLEEQDSL